MTKSSEKQFEFYLEEVCPKGDLIFRLAYLLILNKEAAWTCVLHTFDHLIMELPKIASDVSFHLVRSCYASYKAQDQWPFPDSDPMSQALSVLSSEERASLGSVDIIGLNVSLSAKALNKDIFTLRNELSSARQKFINVNIPA